MFGVSTVEIDAVCEKISVHIDNERYDQAVLLLCSIESDLVALFQRNRIKGLVVQFPAHHINHYPRFVLLQLWAMISEEQTEVIIPVIEKSVNELVSLLRYEQSGEVFHLNESGFEPLLVESREHFWEILCYLLKHIQRVYINRGYHNEALAAHKKLTFYAEYAQPKFKLLAGLMHNVYLMRQERFINCNHFFTNAMETVVLEPEKFNLEEIAGTFVYASLSYQFTLKFQLCEIAFRSHKQALAKTRWGNLAIANVRYGCCRRCLNACSVCFVRVRHSVVFAVYTITNLSMPTIAFSKTLFRTAGCIG